MCELQSWHAEVIHPSRKGLPKDHLIGHQELKELVESTIALNEANFDLLDSLPFFTSRFVSHLIEIII